MKMLINGNKVDSSNKEVIKVFNPATQEYIDSVPSATDIDIELCLDMAKEGKRIWGDTPLYKRLSIMKKFAASILDHKEELALLNCKELGRPIQGCRDEIESTANLFIEFAEHAAHLYDSVIPDNTAGLENDIIFTHRKPLGVVLCIIPFNYPAALFGHKVAPAIAMGNSVIIKPASSNPLTIMRLGELFLECGIPGNVIQIITGSGAIIGKKLIPSEKLDAVTFTGSTEKGIEIAKDSANNLHKTFLELGGNDPLIVLEDADVDYAVNEAYVSRITNAGQICCSSKRFIVHNSIKKMFIDKLVKKLENTIIGDPMDPKTDMGCLISEKAAIEVEDLVNVTIKQGAKCICGGKRFNKTFYQPTLLDNIQPEMDIIRDMEIFGPVWPVIGFDTDEQAAEIANNSIYGLNGGVITKDYKRGMIVASKVESGIVVVNGSGCYRPNECGFGGFKMSGIGREGVMTTMEEMSQLKTYALKGILK